MAEFSGKIVSAFYANEEYDMIKIRWDDNGTLNVYHIPVDENNTDYQELVEEGWDSERLIEETAEELRGQSNAFNARVNDVAQELAKEMLGLDKLQAQKIELERKIIDLDKDEKEKAAKTLQTEIYSYVMNNNEDKDELFKCKLWALETPEISKASKEIKTSIRKATKVLDILNIIDGLK
jgi:hypothetical protein